MQIIKLEKDENTLNLQKDDYVVTYPMDFYAGAGIYEIRQPIDPKMRFARCIELLDGTIKVIGEENKCKFLSPKDFCRCVRCKVLARISMEGCISSIAKSEFEELLARK
jgi:hypothetical protein